MKEKSQVKLDIDMVMEEAGIFGKFQIFTYLLLVLPILMSSMHSNAYIFTAFNTEYRCISDCDESHSIKYQADWLKNTTPAKCLLYQRFNNESYDNTDNETGQCVTDGVSQNCTDYVFKYKHSFIEEMNIPCEDWKRALLGTLHCLGTLFSMPIVGYISDRYGRRFSLILCCFWEGCFGLLKSFSLNYPMFATLEFIEAAVGSNVYTSAYVLGLEVLVRSTRVIGGTIMHIFYATGQIVMALVSWKFPYWRTFLYITSIPELFFVVYYFLLLESSRWLSSKGKRDEVIDNFKKIAKMNGKKIEETSLADLNCECDQPKGYRNQKNMPYKEVLRSKLIVTRMIKCSIWWITCAFCFYGLTMNAVHLDGNFYANFMYISLMEIPAHILAYLFLDRIGRKWTLFIAFLICGICNFAFTLISEDFAWVSFTCYLLGKLSITAAFNGVYMYTSELFPTCLRQSLLSFCSMIGRVGSTIAPFTPLLGYYAKPLPSLLFGSTCFLSAILMLTSPETLNQKLPETIQEAEAISQ